jgi:hypothetical protein
MPNAECRSGERRRASSHFAFARAWRRRCCASRHLNRPSRVSPKVWWTGNLMAPARAVARYGCGGQVEQSGGGIRTRRSHDNPAATYRHCGGWPGLNRRLPAACAEALCLITISLRPVRQGAVMVELSYIPQDVGRRYSAPDNYRALARGLVVWTL